MKPNCRWKGALSIVLLAYICFYPCRRQEDHFQIFKIGGGGGKVKINYKFKKIIFFAYIFLSIYKTRGSFSDVQNWGGGLIKLNKKYVFFFAYICFYLCTR
jgi:hypothetical protein